MRLLKTPLQWSGLMVGYFFLSFNSSSQSRIMSKMSVIAPSPPPVRGMKKLDRKLFDNTVHLPCLKVKTDSIQLLKDVLKNYLLKLKGLRPIRTIDPLSMADELQNTASEKEVLLNPNIVSHFIDLAEVDRNRLKHLGIDESCFNMCPVDLTYDNWTADDVLTAILPEGVDITSGYSLVGHIVHLNLREHLLDYKHVIGEVLLDKIKQARTVVNKVETIDNTFRLFNMEVLAGKPDFITEVKENGLSYMFDFSTVYWNPRLCTEHQRIVKKLSPGNILYDVFAGVGPFVIPAAKKDCVVLANDLNPESYKWLQHNAKLNKVEKLITTYNKDGLEFINTDIKQDILQGGGERISHVVMNLPALAVSFLSAFRQLFSSDELERIKTLPTVHVYCFVKGIENPKEMAKELVEKEMNCSISEAVDEIFFVRNVAPNKDMMRVSFKLTKSMILGGKRKLELDIYQKEPKKINSS